jgi:hypothetical protein
MALQILPAVEKRPGFLSRLGAGMGEALPGAVNKEVERMRLSKGLKELAGKEDLSPFEQFAELSSIPGATPQMIQSGSNLLMQQQRAKAFKDMATQEMQNKPNPFSQQMQNTPTREGSLPKYEDLESIQEGFVSPTLDQEYSTAAQLFGENPARFGNDPQKAIDYVSAQTSRNQQIAQEEQTRYSNLTTLQKNIEDNINKHADNLGVDVPANVRSEILKEAVNSVKPKKSGGQGLTEAEAKDKYGKQLDSISRDYKNLDAIDSWGMFRKTPSSILNSLKTTSDDFAKRKDSENMADTLISDQNLSPSRAFSIAYRVDRDKDLNSELKKIPSVNTLGKPAKSGFQRVLTPEVVAEKTLEVSKKFAKYLENENNSPLAIGYELEKKGYDPQVWMQFVNDNADELRLFPRQRRELTKTDSWTGTMNDWWLNSFTGAK